MNPILWKQLVDEMQVGYIYLTPIYNHKQERVDYKVCEVNKAFLTMFACPQDIINQSISNFKNKDWVLLLNEGKSFVDYDQVKNTYYHFSVTSFDDNFVILVFSISGLDISIENINKQKSKESEEKLRLILDSTAEGIYGIDLNGNCTFINASALKMLGYAKEEVIGKNTHYLFHHHHPDGREYKLEDCKVHQALRTGMSTNAINENFWHKNGEHFNVEYFSYPQLIDGKLVGMVVTFYDITEENKIRQDLKEVERSKSVLLENLQGMAYRCRNDESWTMNFVSKWCKELTGYKASSLINNYEVAFADLIVDDYKDFVQKVCQYAVLNKTSYQLEYPIITASGEKKWVLDKGQPVFNETGDLEALEGIVIDITTQKLKQEEIAFLSYNDALTGIYNRLSFDIEIKRLDKPQYFPLSIIIGDINGLKLVNDAFGLARGDNFIIDTANLLKQSLTSNDFLFRIGGDEFAILMPDTSEKEASDRFEKITKIFKEYNDKVTNETLQVNISLGFATKTNSDEDFANVIKIAEDYMYKRKLFENKSSHSTILASIRTTMFERCEETEQHAERLQLLTRQLGEKLKLSQYELDELALLAALHDIGKVGIDDKILKKPGKLTDEEWVIMKKHPSIGYRIAMSSPELVSIAEYILSHHERWDGTGYPQGLKGNDIPLLARILSVIDAYDAMTANRIYRKALTHEDAILEILDNAGTQFDPNIALTFVNLMNEIKH